MSRPTSAWRANSSGTRAAAASIATAIRMPRRRLEWVGWPARVGWPGRRVRRWRWTWEVISAGGDTVREVTRRADRSQPPDLVIYEGGTPVRVSWFFQYARTAKWDP